MIRFQSKDPMYLAFEAIDSNNDARFTVRENPSYRAGWDLYTLDERIHLAWFKTLCEVEQYIEEMDK